MNGATKSRSHLHMIRPNLFAGLTAHQQEVVRKSSDRRKFLANQIVVRRGDPATRLFLLTDGTAKYYRITSKGDEVLLWWLTPGDAFGMASLLAPSVPLIGTAQAIDDCEFMVWSGERVRSLAATGEVVTQNALQMVLYYLAAFTDRLVGLATGTAKERLALALLQLAPKIGQVRPRGVELPIMNEDLASLANVSPFTASRQLKEWERQGIIEKGRGKVHILSPESLMID
jgi:CRP-like cAMP-binding protein